MPIKRHPAGAIRNGKNVGGQYAESGLANLAPLAPDSLTLDSSAKHDIPEQPRGFFRRINDRWDKASPVTQVVTTLPIFPVATAAIGAGFVAFGGVEAGAALENASVLQGALAGSSVGGLLALFGALLSIPSVKEDNYKMYSKAREALVESGMDYHKASRYLDNRSWSAMRLIVKNHTGKEL